MFQRTLRYDTPMLQGGDVAGLQLRLLELGYSHVGEPDGWYGRQTERAVQEFQRRRGLSASGIVDRTTWQRLFDEPDDVPPKTAPWISALSDLMFPHRFHDSVEWLVTPSGVQILGRPSIERWMGGVEKLSAVWRRHDEAIVAAAERFNVPVELILSTIMTESNGDPRALRQEPGFRSDQATPHKVSAGMMQTLISTAESALGVSGITRQWLYVPANSISAGTAYIAQQWSATRYDPPKVACAYNAGGLYYNDAQANRWRMRQYPIGTSHHADRFVKWFNDSMVLFSDMAARPSISFGAA